MAKSGVQMVTVRLSGKDVGNAFSKIKPAMLKAGEDFFNEKLADIVEVARQNLRKNRSVRTGALSRALASKATIVGKNFVWGAVGVRKGFDTTTEHSNMKRTGRKKKAHNPRKYAHLVERPFTHHSHGKITHETQGKPFVKPALRQLGGETAIETGAIESIRAYVEKEDLGK